MFNPKLSVITIVYNNVRDIERTILSVLIKLIPILNILL
jgi:glycosyltransferase involved in cell wall biosynthesis